MNTIQYMNTIHFGAAMNERVDTKAQERRERKKESVKRVILTSALPLFYEKGYADTSVALIMESVHLATGTFYNYFESKDDLLRQAIKAKFVEIQGELQKIYETELTQRKKLAAVFKTSTQLFAKNRALIGLYMQLPSTEPKEQMKAPHGPLLKELVLSIIKKGQQSGEFRADVPAESISETFRALVQAGALGKPKISPQEDTDFKISILMDGIASEEAKERR
jgi:AcrR family transcriptional regulator